MNILVISVHPDDETLGCGGTILKHSKDGDMLYWMILTEALESKGFTREFITDREEQINKIGEIYNFEKTFKLGFATTRLHIIDFAEIIEKISEVINEVKPEIVYTVNRSDIHTDHQVAAKAVISCTKSFRCPFIKRLMMYECISETEMAQGLPENIFIPNSFSDISEYIDKKLDIMNIYESEIQNPPFPRSLENIRALARFRGASAGVGYAEAFMLIRQIF